MRHRKTTKKLSRLKDHRVALLRNLATTFALSGKVTTTTTKAKALLMVLGRIIAQAKRSDAVHGVRVAKQYFYTEKAQRSFMDRIKELKSGAGALRITKVGFRKGDAAETSMVDLINS